MRYWKKTFPASYLKAVKFGTKMRLSAIEERLADTKGPPSLCKPGNEALQQTIPVRGKLPKPEVQKFGANISGWYEFCDSFKSAIDKNETLADVDKFSYLRGLLMEPPWPAIAGFALTSAYHKAATELLKKRDGKDCHPEGIRWSYTKK